MSGYSPEDSNRNLNKTGDKFINREQAEELIDSLKVEKGLPREAMINIARQAIHNAVYKKHLIDQGGYMNDVEKVDKYIFNTEKRLETLGIYRDEDGNVGVFRNIKFDQLLKLIKEL